MKKNSNLMGKTAVMRQDPWRLLDEDQPNRMQPVPKAEGTAMSEKKALEEVSHLLTEALFDLESGDVSSATRGMEDAQRAVNDQLR